LPLPSDSLYSAATSAPPASLASQDPIRDGVALTSSPVSQSPTPPIPTLDEITTPANREYVVVKGDSFYTIGKKFGVTANAVARANPGINPTRLKIGERLQIPPPAVTTPALQASLDSGADMYVVKAGDNLSSIAKTHHTSVSEIKSLNSLTTDRINAGQKLKMPPARTVAAQTSGTPSATTTPSFPAPTANP
jgi:LysM repeat protein